MGRKQNKVHNQARSRIRWTENKKESNKVSEISRSKNRIDGFPSQMVGSVSILHFRFRLYVIARPLRDSTARLRLDYGIVRTRWSGSPASYLGDSSHSSHPFPHNHDLHPSFPLVGHEVPPRIAFIMSSDYSPPSSSGQHTSRDALYGAAASDANIRNFAPVARIMKTALPENAKIAKEAKECMQECVSEFISFITSEGMSTSPSRLFDNCLPKCRCAASEKCQQEKRKTVNGEDILFAMTSLGFENYAEALKIYLAKYREVSSVLIPFSHLSFVT